jgi:hypothetical protein
MGRGGAPGGGAVVIAFCAIRFQSMTALPIAAGAAGLATQADGSVALADAPDVASTVAALAATATASTAALGHLRKREAALMAYLLGRRLRSTTTLLTTEAADLRTSTDLDY